MAAATYVEVQSFVSKYLHLTSCGIDADLKFSTKNGKVDISFHVSLMNAISSSDNNRHVKPSRLRRRRRRQANRSETSSDEAPIVTKPLPFNQSTTEMEPNSLNLLNNATTLTDNDEDTALQ